MSAGTPRAPEVAHVVASRAVCPKGTRRLVRSPPGGSGGPARPPGAPGGPLNPGTRQARARMKPSGTTLGTVVRRRALAAELGRTVRVLQRDGRTFPRNDQGVRPEAARSTPFQEGSRTTSAKTAPGAFASMPPGTTIASAFDGGGPTAVLTVASPRPRRARGRAGRSGVPPPQHPAILRPSPAPRCSSSDPARSRTCGSGTSSPVLGAASPNPSPRRRPSSP